MPPSRSLSNAELAHFPSTYAHQAWWKEATVFQIWPSSFCDTNGDGVGDLPGIISKVDYLKDLGVDVLWLSPIYESPDKDMGYDVANYKAISPKYGTMEDVDKLIAELGKRDMKLVMDLVVNHTSDQHAWFKDSRSSPTASKRDWYIWRKPRVNPKTGAKGPPNNWVAFFNGSAWQYDAASDEYYLALFTPEQPDLNWENAEVRRAVHDVMRFWLDKGVVGFRMDVINEISKPYVADGTDRPPLPDAEVVDPQSPYQPAAHLFCNGPRVHEFIQELHDEVLGHYDTITVGETPHARHPDVVLPWVHPERKELRMCFQFDFVNLDTDQDWPLLPREWTVPELKSVVNKWQTYFHARDGWNSSYMENHDQARSVSRWASDKPEFRREAAKMLALFHTTLGGTIYVYQGQELGMKSVDADWPMEDLLDVMTINYYKEQQALHKAGHLKRPLSEVRAGILQKARDNGRTPVQWTSGAQAGFTSGVPWMRVQEADAAAGWNAAAQLGDAHSVRSFWRTALAARKALAPAAVYGNFNLVAPAHGQVVAYVRNPDPSSQAGAEGDAGKALLVVLNFSAERVDFELPPDAARTAQEQLEFKSAGPLADLAHLERRAHRVLGSHGEDGAGWKGQTLALRAYEGVSFVLDEA